MKQGMKNPDRPGKEQVRKMLTSKKCPLLEKLGKNSTMKKDLDRLAWLLAAEDYTAIVKWMGGHPERVMLTAGAIETEHYCKHFAVAALIKAAEKGADLSHAIQVLEQFLEKDDSMILETIIAAIKSGFNIEHWIGKLLLNDDYWHAGVNLLVITPLAKAIADEEIGAKIALILVTHQYERHDGDLEPGNRSGQILIEAAKEMPQSRKVIDALALGLMHENEWIKERSIDILKHLQNQSMSTEFFNIDLSPTIPALLHILFDKQCDMGVRASTEIMLERMSLHGLEIRRVKEITERIMQIMNSREFMLHANANDSSYHRMIGIIDRIMGKIKERYSAEETKENRSA